MTVVLPFGNLLCYQVLIVSKKEKIMIPAYAVAAVTNVLLNMLLIRRFAQNGAAIASVIAEVVLNGLEVAIVLRMLKIKLNLRAIGTAIITSVPMVMAVWFITSLEMASWCTLLVSVSCGAVCYFGLNLWMRTPILMEAIQVVQGWIDRKK
jgi:O-antigen/teichoic acid export membrane protein